MDTYANALIDKDVVEHKFIRDSRKRGKEYTLLYSHTRVRVQRERIRAAKEGKGYGGISGGDTTAVIKEEKDLSWKTVFLLSLVTF